MKKYLITALTTIAVIPAVGNTISETNIFVKNHNSEKLAQNNLNSNVKDGIDWHDVNQKIVSALDSPKVLLSMLNSSGMNLKDNDLPTLTSEQKEYAKQQTKGYIDKFKQQNFTQANQVTNYLQNNNSDFKNYYSDPIKGATNLNDKLLFHYFNNKIDLKLSGSNTYQDAISALTNNIKQQYSSVGEVKITLDDSKLATQTLFDDSNTNSILTFVDNHIAIPVTVQIGNNKPQEQKIQLKNVTLNQNNKLENNWLTTAVNSYFDESNPQNINLNLEDTRQTAFDKVLAKIKARFPNYGNTIKVNLQNPGAASQNFYNDSIVNNVANENAWMGVNISSNGTNKSSRFYVNFDLSYLNMNNLINQLYLTGSSNKNLQDLALTTDSTYQDAMNKFNERLRRLDSSNIFSAYLINSKQASTKLQDQYKPNQTNQTYQVKIGFQVKIDDKNVIKLGETSLGLTNVALGKEAKEVKQAYDDLQELLRKITLGQNIVDTTAVVLGVAAAALWASAWFFGISTGWAIACTVAASALGTASAAMSIAMVAYKQKIGSLFEGALLVWKINRLGLWLGLLIYAIYSGVTTVLTATTWASFGLVLTGISAILVIVAWISYYNENHKG